MNGDSDNDQRQYQYRYTQLHSARSLNTKRAKKEGEIPWFDTSPLPGTLPGKSVDSRSSTQFSAARNLSSSPVSSARDWRGRKKGRSIMYADTILMLGMTCNVPSRALVELIDNQPDSGLCGNLVGGRRQLGGCKYFTLPRTKDIALQIQVSALILLEQQQ